jgi:hypothetical protein
MRQIAYELELWTSATSYVVGRVTVVGNFEVTANELANALVLNAKNNCGSWFYLKFKSFSRNGVKL